MNRYQYDGERQTLHGRFQVHCGLDMLEQLQNDITELTKDARLGLTVTARAPRPDEDDVEPSYPVIELAWHQWLAVSWNHDYVVRDALGYVRHRLHQMDYDIHHMGGTGGV